ncbi:MAG: hypothetical protein SFU56_18260 [Capsulimonadales bacterium]|nr:hypothetical protein [Capsulimonadales bacterium]
MQLRLILCLWLLLGWSPVVLAQEVPAPSNATPSADRVRKAVPKEACFPLEELPAELRTGAEKMLLELLDSEALFTIIGGLKPMSSGFAQFRISVRNPEVGPLAEARQILATFRCGDVFHAELLPFHTVDKGTRYLEAVVFHRPALRDAITRHRGFFAPFGITPTTDPLSVAVTIENDPTTARNRGLGYLYGYPPEAVDFFVTAAEEQKRTGKFVERDFVQIPVFKAPTGHFVYAVPKGFRTGETDRILKAKAERILAAYRERRARFIGEGKPGVVALLRDWFDIGNGLCSPDVLPETFSERRE